MSSASSEYLKKHEIVRAGAGAGKTYTLTHKVMEIADQHLKTSGRLPRVIVTTFTRKATQELRERLMLLALEEKPHLIDFINSRSHLVVSTMHGVMDLYLKRFGANICIDPSYKVIASAEASKIARQVLRQLLFSEENAESLLQDFQFNRLVTLVRQLDHVFAENPEAQPFTEADFEKIFATVAGRAADELELSARQILSETDKDTWVEIAEGHRKLAGILRASNWPEQRPLFLALLEDQKTIRKPGRGQAHVMESTIELAKSAREMAKEFKDSSYDPSVWSVFTDKFIAFEKVAKIFSETFRKEKLDRGALEISDLEMRAMQCIRSHPETVEAFWQEWDHWLIDEYQDTSPFQVELIRHLSGQSPAFVVGDPQQSIYLFRGARSEVFGLKENEIIKGGGQQRFLKMNRRSRPELLLFLNEFFCAFTPPFNPMEPFIKEGASVDPSKLVATFFIGSEPLVKEEDASDQPEKNQENSIRQELDAIASHVQKLLSAGAKPEDICILGRTNKDLTEVANHLSLLHLPLHVHSASGFYDRREICDALSFLKFLVNPHDNKNTIELLRSPWFRVPDHALAPIAKTKPDSYWDQLSQENSMADEFLSIRRLNRYLQDSMVEGFSEVFQKALIESGFIDLSHAHDVSGRRESNVWKLLSRLQMEERRPGFNPLEFISGSLSDLKDDEGNAEGDAVAAVEPDRINLMTVHASKGLEFKHVLLPRADSRPRLSSIGDFTYDESVGQWALKIPLGEEREPSGSLPQKTWLERFKMQELQEHARVLYVALTRAVESVFMSWTEPVKSDSWASLVKLDLSEGFHQMDHYQYQVLRGDQKVAAAIEKRETALEPRDFWKKQEPTVGALGLFEGAQNEMSISVTDILDRKTGMKLVSGSDREVVSRLRIASEGTAVHRLMELLKYPSQAHLERLILRWFPGKEEKVLKGIEFVRSSVHPTLLEIIHNGEVEWGFAVVEDGILIEGQIDLWGRTNSGEAWIVDYKTGSVAYREKAFEQMSLYAFALRKSGMIQPEETLRLAAVYPFDEKIFVQDEPSAEKVRSMLGLKK